ncbi:unnamed protein product [Closterium sp. NIES-65]|nr:unnamed protein product [Closterium sp. NIES-65]
MAGSRRGTSKIEKVGFSRERKTSWEASPEGKRGARTAKGAVAEAAAGNSNVQISNIGAASGMAPGARLAIYKVFWQAGGNLYATSTDIFSAVDQAVADGVDVLSLSLGGASSTDTDFDDVPFISVNAAGVFVAFAAGNEGRPSSAAASGYRTLCNFAPFYMTVGASSISRNDASISSTTAAAATAATETATTTTATAATVAPMESHSNTTASTVSTLNGARIPASISPAATAAPVVAYFSSTGPLDKPSSATPAAYPSNTILKPDIIAPGVGLWSAAPDKTVGSGGWFVALSGTSMATPHIAGIAALIIQQRPDWTPSQIMSAMMTTARTTDTNNGAIQNEFGRAATPWEIGAGHVVPARVVNPRLTYNAGEQDFQNFLAGQNYNRAKEDSSSSASGAEPREAASSQSDVALRDEADSSSESHGQQAAAAFGMRHGEAEGDDLAEDFDYLDLEDLEQTWPERRESILGTRCGSPKGATEIGIMRSDAISRAWQGGVAGGPTQPVLFKLECLLLCSLHASAGAGAGAAHMALLCCALYICAGH